MSTGASKPGFRAQSGFLGEVFIAKPSLDSPRSKEEREGKKGKKVTQGAEMGVGTSRTTRALAMLSHQDFLGTCEGFEAEKGDILRASSHTSLWGQPMEWYWAGREKCITALLGLWSTRHPASCDDP